MPATRDATPEEKSLWMTMIVFTQPAFNSLPTRSPEFRALSAARSEWEAALGFAPVTYGRPLQVYVGRNPLEA